MGINSDVASDFIGRTVNVLRFAETLRSDLDKMVASLSLDIENSIIEDDLFQTSRLETKRDRTEKLVMYLMEEIADFFEETVFPYLFYNSQLFETVEEKSTISILELATAKGIVNSPKRRSRLVVLGSNISEWVKKISNDLTLRVVQQVRIGSALGEQSKEVSRRVLGVPRSSRVKFLVDGERLLGRFYTGGVIEITKRELFIFTRTLMMTIANKTRDDIYENNSNLIKGRQALTVLDGKNSPVCRALSGGAWDFNGDPLVSSDVKARYLGSPCWHFGCRTIIIPVFFSWEEISRRKVASRIPENKRSDFDGELVQGYSFEEWLKSKDVDTQKLVLGETRWKLWNSGKLGIAQMVDQTGRPLSISELNVGN